MKADLISPLQGSVRYLELIYNNIIPSGFHEFKLRRSVMIVKAGDIIELNSEGVTFLTVDNLYIY